MQVHEVIEGKRREIGIPVTELSRRCEIPYQNLWVSLRGERKIPATEFVVLCKYLGLGIEDF